MNLLVVVYRLVIEMRRSYVAFVAVTRSQAAVLDVGLRRADTMYPALAVQIRADAVGMKTLLDVAAKAIVEQTSFAVAWASMSPSYTLSPQIFAFFESALASPLPES